MEFDWADGNIGHIVDDHGVWPEEVIEVLYARPVWVGKGFIEGECVIGWWAEQIKVLS